ncbi:hypothetical protein PLICRDRAFT_70441, partial [Plicaturopsis crispa FD-325 SS-3]
IHQRPVEPTPDTLSFFVVFMCHHISPNSVDNYLSGICNQLESHFPNIRAVRTSLLVSRSLQGCKRLHGRAPTRKRALTKADLQIVFDDLSSSASHDDKLFLAQLLSGFHALMRLGELVWPDTVAHQNYRKVSLRFMVEWYDDAFSFWLPAHKSDPFFEGNRIVIERTETADPHRSFAAYLRSRDLLFPNRPELWLLKNGHIPTRSWFIRRLRHYFPKDIAGHSLRSGGATHLAERGVPSSIIQ